MGFLGAALCVCCARGPWEKGWVGWRGGWGIRRRDLKAVGQGGGDVQSWQEEPKGEKSEGDVGGRTQPV